MKSSILRPGGLFVVALVAAACGSSSMGAASPEPRPSSAPSLASAASSSAASSSITSNAMITIEGDPVTESDLKLGMVAAVRGVVDRRSQRGTADVVSVDHLAEGPLDAVDASTGTLLLLGQQVLSDHADRLRPGAARRARARRRRRGERLSRTRAAHPRDPGRAEGRGNGHRARGFIEDLDTEESSRSGSSGLVVDFSGALIESAPASGACERTLRRDREAEDRPVGGVFVAVGVEVIDPTLMADEGDGLGVEGFVTQITSATEFVVNGAQRVRITSGTRASRAAMRATSPSTASSTWTASPARTASSLRPRSSSRGDRDSPRPAHQLPLASGTSAVSPRRTSAPVRLKAAIEVGDRGAGLPAPRAPRSRAWTSLAVAGGSRKPRPRSRTAR